MINAINAMINNKINKAAVFYNNKKAGILLKREDGFEFEYDNEYINNPDSKPISKTMPLGQKSFFRKTFCLF